MDFLTLLEGLRTDFTIQLFELVTMLGEKLILILLIAVLYFAYDKHFARRILFLTVFSLCINGVIKNIVKRPRPFYTGKVTCARPQTATGYSFPSGHTQTFATWSSVLATKYKKIWITVLAVMGILLVAFSRMFLGAHYPGDVIVGGILGTGIAVVGSILYDKVEDKNHLYVVSILGLAPFAVLFLVWTDVHYADFYKLYGMLIGMFFAIKVEEKYALLEYDVVWWKKLLRVVIAIVVALGIQKGSKVLDVFQVVQLSMIVAAVRYLLLVFVVLGLCPVVFKKLKM